MNDKLSMIAMVLITIVLFLIMIGMSGCSRQPEYKIIYKTKLVVEKPPAAIIQPNIETPRPPNKYMYVNADPLTREFMLTNYIIDLLKTVKKYKIYSNAVIKWYNDTEKNVKAINTTNGK